MWSWLCLGTWVAIVATDFRYDVWRAPPSARSAWVWRRRSPPSEYGWIDFTGATFSPTELYRLPGQVLHHQSGQLDQLRINRINAERELNAAHVAWRNEPPPF
jgi:hypothetical protein